MKHAEFFFHDGLVIWRADSGKIDCLNSSASVIFEGVKKSLSIEDIAENLVARFNCDFPQALADTKTTFRVLETHGLLSTSEDQTDLPGLHSAEDIEIKQCPHSEHSFFNSLTVRVTDCFVRISVCEEKLIRDVINFLTPPAVEPASATACVHVHMDAEGSYSVCVNQNLFATKVSSEAIVACLFQALTHAALKRENVLFTLHGGIVRTKNKNVLVSGRSGSGKSTLIASLAAAGFACSHDDVVPIVVEDCSDDASVSLCALSVATPICLKQGSWHCVNQSEEQFYSINSKRFDAEPVLFLKPKLESLCVNDSIDIPKTIVFPEYSDGIGFQTDKLNEIETLQRLIDSQLQASSRLTENSLSVFLKALQDVDGCSLRYDDLEQATEFVANL